MSRLVIYIRQPLPSRAEMRADVKRAIQGINKWFEDHPRRRVCNTGIWCGEILRIPRGKVEANLKELLRMKLKEKTTQEKANGR